MRREQTLLASCLALALVRCVGLIGEPPALRAPPGPRDDAAAVDDSAAAGADAATRPPSTTSEVPLRRLSRLQYSNTITDVVRAVSTPADADMIVQDYYLHEGMVHIPDDRRVSVGGATHGGFRRLDQVVGMRFTTQAYVIASRAATLLTSQRARLERLVGACATDADAANDAACLDAFITRFGLRAHRRPLDADDVAFYRETAGGRVAPEAIADVVTVMLSSPRVLFHVEHGGAPDADGTVPLDPYDLAARLSYQFWQSAPDDALYAAAADGSLATDAGYAREVDRLAADPRADAAYDQFFREYLWLDEIPGITDRSWDPTYVEYAGADRPGATTREELITEAVESARWVVRSGGGLTDVFTNRLSFARTPFLAGIYHTPAWDGAGTPPMLTQPERAGLLTRAAFLINESIGTRPILKGHFIRSGLLCDTLPPPPNNAAATQLRLAPSSTTRRVIEQVTQAEGTSCAGCHTRLINPFGFVTENFDSLGRVRTTEHFYGDTTGPRDTPVDTNVTLYITPDAPRAARDAAGLTAALVESDKLAVCFARQYFRFTFGRAEDSSAQQVDRPVLDELAQQARGGRPLTQLMRALVLRPEFRSRRFD